jgi:hypothetical protein
MNSQSLQRRNPSKLLDGTAQVLQIVHEVRRSLSSVVDALDLFCAPTGDIAYFSDLSDPESSFALSTMRSSFQDLRQLERRVVDMERRCKTAAGCVRPDHLPVLQQPVLTGEDQTSIRAGE